MDGWIDATTNLSNGWIWVDGWMDATHPWMNGCHHSPIQPMNGWIKNMIIIITIISSIIVDIVSITISIYDYHYYS